jgi:competence/damage-inducible protein CinA-like protein
MAIAEIITIGTELLLGEIQDTNSKFIARVLRDIGVDLYRLSTVGDNCSRISATINEAMTRSDIVITTGGLGPTVDDPTRQAVADAAGVPLVYRDDLWETIITRFERYQRKPTDNNKRQAYIPAGAMVINNEVGTAPAFVVEIDAKSIISLPGVPREMEFLMNNFVLNYLKTRYQLQDTVIKSRVLHTVSLGESAIDEIIGDMEEFNNPTVGLLAHPGQTDIRVTAKAPSEHVADTMIAPIVEEIYRKLGKYIYGEDKETIAQAVSKLIIQKELKLAIIECGLDGEFINSVKPLLNNRFSSENLDVQLSVDSLKTLIKEYIDQKRADIILGAKLSPENERRDLDLVLYFNGEYKEISRSYGGPPGDAPIWTVNSGLDFIRRTLLAS